MSAETVDLVRSCASALRSKTELLPSLMDPEGIFVPANSAPGAIDEWDRIKCAAVLIYSSRKIYRGTCHAEATMIAFQDGFPEDDIGDQDKMCADLFLTHGGKLIDRIGAARFFGIAASEDMCSQKRCL